MVCFALPAVLIAQLDFSGGNQSSNPFLNQMEENVVKGNYEAITSILVAKKGKLVYEKYFNGSTVDTKHNTRSATKTIATILVGLAMKKGYIHSEKDGIFTYLKPRKPIKNEDPRKDKITIEDLLTMSSILECDDNNSFSRGNEERMYIIEDWLQFFVDLPVGSYPFGPKPEESPYGRVMSYCSAGAAALAEVVQAAVGQPSDTFLKENFLDPLEITDYEFHYTPTHALNTAGGSGYRSRDFLKMIQAFLQKGQWNGEELLSEDWIAKATTPKANAREDVDYGYLIWLKSFGSEKKYSAYYMSGNGGQKVLAIPELDLAVVITTTNYGNRKGHGYTDELMDRYIVPAFEK